MSDSVAGAGPDTGPETGEFTDDGGAVVVERTVERAERGLVVTLTVETGRPEPVGFVLVEEFPAALPVSDAGFRPGTEPAGGRIDADGLRVEDTVAPEEPSTVVYALQFFEPAPAVDLNDPELVVGEDRPTAGGTGAVGTTRSVRTRGGSAVAPPGRSEAARGAFRDAVAPDAGATGPAGSDETDPLGAGPGHDPSPRAPGGVREDDPGNPTDGRSRGRVAAEATDRPRAETDGGGTAGVVDTDGSPERADDGGAAAGGDDTEHDAGESRADRADAVETAERVDEAVETAERVRPTDSFEGSTDTGADGARAAGGGVVSELVAELRDGSVSDRERAALRRELGVGHAGAEDVRIEHLESRMSEFAAYADALAEVLDEHGTAEAFVGRFEDRIDGLRSDLDAVESELSTTRETVAGVDDSLDALVGRLDALEERTEADVEALRGTLERVESDLAAVEDETEERAAAVEALREEAHERHDRNAEAVDRLETRLETVEAFREELASVFDELEGGPD